MLGDFLEKLGGGGQFVSVNQKGAELSDKENLASHVRSHFPWLLQD